MIEIGGIQKTTLIDYPGRVAATVFLIGCNFRCPFCYSAELVLPEKIKLQPRISDKEFFGFLRDRRGLLEGIVVCGGEPTIHQELPDFIKKIKDLGFLVKLDTNGSNPELLSELIEKKLVDFIAMDIKTSLGKYAKAINAKIDLENIEKSVELIKNSGIDYEFRTTVVPGMVEKEDIEKISEWLQGAKKITLQQFQNQKVLDKNFEKLQPYSDKTLKEFAKILQKHIKEVKLRT